MHLDTWTLALQAANFLVLVWLLNRFLYRPVKAVIAKRRAATQAVVHEAEAEKAKAEALRRDLEAQRSAVEAERQQVLQTARAAAEAERGAVLARASEEAAKSATEGKEALMRARAEAVEGLGRDAARLAASLTRRILAESPRAEVQAGLVEAALDEVRRLPAEARRGVLERAAAGQGGCVVTTAEPLSPAAAKRFGEKLSAAIGTPTRCDFKVDAALIAGVELRFPFTRIRRAWSDDLARLEKEMSRDEPASPVA